MVTTTDTDTPISFRMACPVLRIFDEAKARAFYCDFLGFQTVFEHRYDPSFPIYIGLERAGLHLHLSEHHGDGCPGAMVFVRMQGIVQFAQELQQKNYAYARPDIVDQPWGRQMEVHDPFGNRIRFCQDHS